LVLQAGTGRAFLEILVVKRVWVAVLSLLLRRKGEVSLRFEEAEAMGEEVGEQICLRLWHGVTATIENAFFRSTTSLDEG
jgi:hypothetical protein